MIFLTSRRPRPDRADAGPGKETEMLLISIALVTVMVLGGIGLAARGPVH